MSDQELRQQAERKAGISDLAYEAAVHRLDMQDQTVANLRNRAQSLLSVSALGTSFAAAASRFHVANIATPGKVFAGLAVLVMFIIGLLCLSILRPADWHMCASVDDIIKHPPGDLASVKVELAKKIDGAGESNDEKIEKLAGRYDLCIVLLVLQMAFLVALAIFR